MKLLFFNDYRMGVLNGDLVVDVTGVLQHLGIKPPEMLMEEVMTDFPRFRSRFAEVVAREDGVPRLWINGELRQDYNTSEMTHAVAAQIAWLTQYITLMPGDVICCGTHHVGLSPINNADRVEMEVEGLERLRLNVRAHGPRKTVHWQPPETRQA